MEALAASKLYLLPPPVKGNRRKGSRRCRAPQLEEEPVFQPVGNVFVPNGYKVIGVRPVDPCCLSREMQREVYCVDFKTRTRKPRWLYPVRYQGQTCSAPDLSFLIGRETGKCYYAEGNLTRSSTASWALSTSPSPKDAYSRRGTCIVIDVGIANKICNTI